MIFKVILSLIFTFALSSTSVVPSLKVLQGPGSKTIVIGPDGAVVDSKFPGGTVVTDPEAPAGVLASGPALLPASPELTVGGRVGKIITSYTLGGPGIVSGIIKGEEGRWNDGGDYDDGSWKGY